MPRHAGRALENAPRTTELYAHEHQECVSGTGYQAWAWFWVPGNDAEEKYTSNGWECGASAKSAQEEFAWIFFEGASNGIDDD